MKKKYSKPEVCCVDCKTGTVLSTSEVFATRTAEIKNIFENGNELKEGFIDGGKTSGKS